MIKPIRDHILIEIALPEKETKTTSGIIVSSTAVAPTQTLGKVLATGEGRALENGNILPCAVKPGDQVIYYDYAGVVVHPENKEANKSYLIIKQNDIIAIVSEA